MTRSHRKIRWRINVGWVGRLVVICVVLVFLGWILRPRLWDGKKKVTVALVTPSLMAVSYDPVKEELVVWPLPDTLQIEVVGGYGMYPAQSIYGLDLLEKRGGQLVSDSLGYFLGVGVDGYIANETKAITAEKIDKALVEQRLRWGLLSLWGQKGHTSLSLVDRWLLWRAVVKTRLDKFTVVNLVASHAVNEVALPDGSKAYQADMQRVSALVQRYMTDERLANEDVTVLVLNATDSGGLGGVFGRMLGTVGIRVVGIEDDERRREVTAVEVGSGQEQQTSTNMYIEKLLNTTATVVPFGESRGRIVVRLGRDYEEKIRGKDR